MNQQGEGIVRTMAYMCLEAVRMEEDAAVDAAVGGNSKEDAITVGSLATKDMNAVSEKMRVESFASSVEARSICSQTAVQSIKQLRGHAMEWLMNWPE